MLKKLLTGVLALTLVANVSAKNVEETQVANFIEAAHALNLSDAEIKAVFEAALINADENAVTEAFNKLNADQKKILAVVLVASAAALVVAGYCTREGKVPFKKAYNKFFGPAVNNNNQQPNAGAGAGANAGAGAGAGANAGANAGAGANAEGAPEAPEATATA